MALQIKLAKKLKRMRRKKGLTQNQLADKLGIKHGTYNAGEINSNMSDEMTRKVLNWMAREEKK